ncbi:membrane protein insertase YidC [Magnetospirillum gryphiswaldense]|uniref:Membrane protein insertase YidC n=1 Tax=Magnetospirillum gryphiswaldense TaxID=55518 RepID=A4TZQ4_9PROT|nr:membrane protein insertase YidC [Magnetospirillum gryphiswaldense]AVM75039.1 Membrane protein insertase YidC [Magnetospirillum gryphiswaldense MSR-1]AVM78942.1 Membrane protein insertase YidC [Magnetospirillum gryphiswaldense]CAM76111.1 60 kDa inner membrane insertion protein [Magnetospirillum gryphiswaldense MSR-1]
MNEQRNLFLAIALSVLILFGFQWLFPSKTPAPESAPATTAAGTPPVPTSGDAVVPAPVQTAAQMAVKSRTDALATAKRIRINTPTLHGSLSVTGARLDDLTLAGYHETADPTSKEIELLSPTGAAHPYHAEFGWVPVDAGVKTPGPDTVWSVAQGNELSPGSTVVLNWDNGDGLRFVRTVSVDENYMFQIAQRVENYGTKPVTLHPFGLISRTGTPKTEGMYILHEGPLGVFDGTLKEHKYDDLKKLSTERNKTTGGWIGITDKYWLTALVPDQKEELTGRFVHQRADNADRYQVDFTGAAKVVAPGAAAETTFHLFAGAKLVSLLDHYTEKFGVERFDLAIDFGWFYFLTKPFFYLLKMMNSGLGNMGLAILALTVLIKGIMFPLANKSYASMSKMKLLQPQVKALQERFGDDKVRLQQEMMALYKKEKVNPVSGCLPILIQIPVFFALYKVLFVAIEMRHAPFYGWIKDLSAQDPTTIMNLFGLIPWDPALYLPAFLHIGVWPLIMGATMWLQQKLNPQPLDPVQAKMMMFLPVVFTFMLGQFAAGLVIYWAWSNILSIAQQWVIMRKYGVKP